ncbi:MAG: FIST N-terminal domain-containing protein [Campylobacterota bacterium]|nr:FIST N-terminal domain-containing protein [Campylobacterota bacterium]
MKSTLISVYTIEDLIEEVDEKIKEGFKPSLAFVYASVYYDIRKLVAELNKYPFHIFGSTTVGEVFADEMHGVNEVDESIVCMLVEVAPEAIALKMLPVEGDEYYKVGGQVGKWAKSQFEDVSVITMTSGLMFDNDAYTQGILSTGITYAFGGAAGDDLILKDTLVFSGKNYSDHGTVVLALDNKKIEVVGSRAFGWIGIGKEKIVTKAHKNIVDEIDNRPAVEFYKSYLQVETIDMPQTGIEYPLEVTMRNGQVVYRAVLDIDEENGALVFAGHVEEKSKVRISAPQGREIMKYVDESITKSIDEHEGFEPEIALVFPCCSRKQVLGAITSQEIEIAYKASKCPLVGCFVYGEIGAFPGGYGFHNETFVTALLKEKE